MPSGKTHGDAGMLVGGLCAAMRADLSDEGASLEVLGGAIAGYVGGRLPDLLEPAHHPNHRDAAHSLGAACAAAGFAAKCAELSEECRRFSRRCFSAARGEDVGDLKRAFLRLLGMAARMLAGALAGAAAGFVSHIALDATTPRSVPLLVRRF